MKEHESENEAVLWDNQFKEDVKSGRFFWLTNKSVIDFERGNFKNFWLLYENLSKDVQKFQIQLPDYIIPGPLAYLTATDCLVISNSNYELECYRYQSMFSFTNNKIDSQRDNF